MIDPKRQAANDRRAALLIRLQRRLIEEAVAEADSPQAVLEAISTMADPLAERMVRHAPHPDRQALSEPFPTDDAGDLAGSLIHGSVIALRDAIRALEQPLVYSVNGRQYELRQPKYLSALSSVPLNPLPPLLGHVCPDLAETIFSLTMLVHEPFPDQLLAIERGHYARERTKLLQIEQELWQRAAEFGGPSDRLPYASRYSLTLLTWHPSAYKPPGAYAVCIRCGQLLYRKRPSLQPLARCSACMKETKEQRRWPDHAIAPHGRGTWFLRCRYPDCGRVFEGRRQRNRCDEHVSSKMPPKRRMKAATKPESNAS